jgi:asparagine synthase (glutamine-hydrolysing)
MCGISGVFHPERQFSLAGYYAAHTALRHRGPDDEGFVALVNNEVEHFKGNDTIAHFSGLRHINELASAKLVLGHRRLSIIDLSEGGHQPYVYEDLAITYNGELYNYKEIRTELEKCGYQFSTNSDTEVFLKAFHFYGEKCFERFTGMWACAIYNRRSNELLLTRDYFGIKPLYYSTFDNQLSFASEIKFLLQFNKKLAQPDADAITDFVEAAVKDHSGHTFYKEIRQLTPGMVLKHSAQGFSKQPHELKPQKEMKRVDVYNDVSESIDMHLVSDVPVGVSLSGGIDSSVITAYLASRSISVKSFSSVFPQNKKFDESDYIKDTLAQYERMIQPFFIETTFRQSWDAIGEILSCMDEPYRVIGMFQPFSVYRLAREKNVPVILGGQGADELFGGYKSQLEDYYREVIRKMKLAEILRARKQGALTLQLVKQALRESRLFAAILGRPHVPAYRCHTDSPTIATSRSRYFNVHLREYLVSEDRLSMWSSVESRVPFLTSELYRKYGGVPLTALIKNGISKYMLRMAFKKLLPKSVFGRKDKMGYVSPQEVWLEQKRSEMTDYIVTSPCFSLFSTDPQKIAEAAHHKLWRYYIVARWHEKFIAHAA